MNGTDFQMSTASTVCSARPGVPSQITLRSMRPSSVNSVLRIP